MFQGDHEVTVEEAAAELLRRRRARSSLVAFSQAVEIPGKPLRDYGEEDDWLYYPIETGIADLHILMMTEIQRCLETHGGRLMLFFPPGAAKSTYASVVAPAWYMGGEKPRDVIVTSYSDVPAERCSRRIQAIMGQPAYQAIWPHHPTMMPGNKAVGEWTTTHGSRLLATGIMGGVTSARADALIIDDPVAGREEADSETIRRKTQQAYEDDLKTRLKPGASIILMMTRWHANDLAGSILPDDYDGTSGDVLCKDGKVWRVICCPAKAERRDDPLGRDVGEYLWPEWFDADHWANYEPVPGQKDGPNPRTWNSLYQQRPTMDTGGKFEKAWFRRHKVVPEQVAWYGASDWAVTEKTIKTNPDFTEHGVAAITAVPVPGEPELYLDDWWFGQEQPAKSIAAWLGFLVKYEPDECFMEQGVIKNALDGALRIGMEKLDPPVYTVLRYMPSSQDKVAKAVAFQQLAENGKVSIREGAWGDRLIAQLCAFPFGRYDDGVDVCGLFGRAVQRLRAYPTEPETKKKPIEPMTEEHFTMDDADDDSETVRRYHE